MPIMPRAPIMVYSNIRFTEISQFFCFCSFPEKRNPKCSTFFSSLETRTSNKKSGNGKKETDGCDQEEEERTERRRRQQKKRRRRGRQGRKQRTKSGCFHLEEAYNQSSNGRGENEKCSSWEKNKNQESMSSSISDASSSSSSSSFSSSSNNRRSKELKPEKEVGGAAARNYRNQRRSQSESPFQSSSSPLPRRTLVKNKPLTTATTPTALATTTTNALLPIKAIFQDRRGSLKSLATSILERKGSFRKNLAEKKNKPGSLRIIPQLQSSSIGVDGKSKSQRSWSLPVTPVQKVPPPATVNDPESPTAVVNALISAGVTDQLKAQLRIASTPTQTPILTRRKRKMSAEDMTRTRSFTSSNCSVRQGRPHFVAMSSSESGFDTNTTDNNSVASSSNNIMDLKQVHT